MKEITTLNLTVTETAARCPVGEEIGQRNTREGAVPVLSCEGACIRGEIARLAANRLAKMPGYRRGCHGELFAVPASAMAAWVRDAEQVVVIDGCPLKCHTRIVEHLVAPGRLRGFNALARYRKHADVFDIDAVPEAERKAIADDVASWVHHELRTTPAAEPTASARGSVDGARTPSPPDATSAAATGCAGTPSLHFNAPVGALVGIGAAVAANCEPCLEHHVREAERHGVSQADLQSAVEVATRVKEAPHRKILATAERLTRVTSATVPCCGRAGK